MRILREIGAKDLTEFVRDPLIHGAAERYLQLSIECLIDIGNHVIADSGYRRPENYADVFAVLAESKAIDDKLYQDLQGIAGFRNLLVHDYLRVDLTQVYRIMQDKLPTFERLAEVYLKLLESTGSG